MAFSSGVPAIDRYVGPDYDSVRGMSSRFAAVIVGHVLRRQSETGIVGSIAEIGTFEGRFFIAMAMALREGEHAYGFDVFTWPDDKVQDRLMANCDRMGLSRDIWTARPFDTGKLTERDFSGLTGAKPLRFIHIDGDHSLQALTQDLRLAHAALHPQGIICLDDMLHPGYPFLVVAVHDYLKAHPQMRLMAVIDREDIVAAPKFMLCRADAVPLYERDLMDSFSAQHFTMGGDALGHLAVVLTPAPRLAKV